MDFGTQTPFTGTKAERLALTDLPTHRARLFVETDTGKIYVCWDLVWHELQPGPDTHRLLSELLVDDHPLYQEGQSAAEEWVSLGNVLPSARYNGVALLFRDAVYYIGGGGVAASEKVYKSVDMEHWAEVGTDSFPVALNNATGVVFEDAMYVWGGTCLRKVYTSTDGETWSEVGTEAIPSNRDYVNSLVYDGKMWSLGGGVLEEVLYSTDGITWAEAGTDAMPEPLGASYAFVYDDKMWLAGGYTALPLSTRSNKVYSSTDGITWTEAGVNSMPANTAQGGACVYNDKMWIVGGYEGAQDTDQAWWSQDGESWTEAGTNAFPEIRATRMVVKGGRMYAIGGFTSGGASWDDVWYAKLDVELHATEHENGGADEISVASLSGLLADGQTPIDHDHSGDAGDGGVLEIDEALVATGATTGHVLTVQADDSIAAAAAAGGGAAVLDYDSARATGYTSTTSNSYVDLNSMSVSVTVAVDALIVLDAYVASKGSAAKIVGDFVITTSGNTVIFYRTFCHCPVIGYFENLSWGVYAAVAAGTHTYKIRYREPGSGTTYVYDRVLRAVAFAR